MEEDEDGRRRSKLAALVEDCGRREKKIFMSIILNGRWTVVPNALGRTVHFPGNGKGKGSCCGVVFMTFLKFSLKCREGNPCREAASNALSQRWALKIKVRANKNIW
jgi:hypothetical protein